MIPKISEGILKKWRKEALNEMSVINSRPLLNESVSRTKEFYSIFLRMNQELLDQHLVKGGD